MVRGKPRIVSLVGARPQFIKLAPLVQRLARVCRHIIVHSGQHYDYELSQIFFRQLAIPRPDINLNVGSGEHGRQTGRILERCEKVLLAYRPEMVLVYGDTNTTLAGALAAAKLNIPVGHVEAGLRSFRMAAPEEINRRLTDHVSTLLFYPTPTARRNLVNEGVSRGLVRSGDVMYELLDGCLPKIARMRNACEKHGVEHGNFVLVTVHRAENVDHPDRLEQFIAVMNEVSAPILFPAHPRTVKNLRRFGLYGKLKKINGLVVARPQPYIELLALMAASSAVLTDSGGIQKEAHFLGRPCLTLRPETEWVETVTDGGNILVDMSVRRVRYALRHLPRRRRRTRYRVGGRTPSDIISAAVIDYLRKN